MENFVSGMIVNLSKMTVELVDDCYVEEKDAFLIKSIGKKFIVLLRVVNKEQTQNVPYQFEKIAFNKEYTSNKEYYVDLTNKIIIRKRELLNYYENFNSIYGVTSQCGLKVSCMCIVDIETKYNQIKQKEKADMRKWKNRLEKKNYT